jgi:hypothetical protein
MSYIIYIYIQYFIMYIYIVADTQSKRSGMEIVAHLEPPQVLSASPAMLDGVLYVKSPNHLPHSLSLL